MIGDYGTTSQDSVQLAKKVVAANPDFVLAAGDARYGNVTYDDANGTYCPFLHGVTPGPNCPTGGTSGSNRFFAAAGNHDYSDGNFIDGFTDYFDLPGHGVTSPNASGSELYYDVLYGPVHVFVIDSTAMLNIDGAAEAQSEWLRTGLLASTAEWQVVMMHHAPFSSSTAHGSNHSMQMPYASWGADLVVAGHNHTYERLKLAGTTYIVNGLGNGNAYDLGTPIFGSQAAYNQRAGAVYFEATSTSLTGSFINNLGETIDSFAVNQVSPSEVGGFAERLTPVLSGDYDLSCTVDLADRQRWTETFGSTAVLSADGNGNGIVDAADATVWRDNLGRRTNGACSNTAVWTLENRYYASKLIHAAADGNVDLSATPNNRSRWKATRFAGGLVLQNVETDSYLTAADWEVYTTSTVNDNAYWELIENSDNSFSLRNVATRRFLDGDGESDGWDVDESESALDDDGWFIREALE